LWKACGIVNDRIELVYVEYSDNSVVVGRIVAGVGCRNNWIVVG
jgi:hypothetical protein